VKRSALSEPDAAAVERGLPNLEKHVESIRLFGEPPVVALNRFGSDAEEEIAVVARRCAELGVPCAVADHHRRGGEGAMELARAVVEHAERRSVPFRPLYSRSASVPEKIEAVASKMYGAAGVEYSSAARSDLELIERLGYADLPVCIAKIPGSLSDDAHRRGRPAGFRIHVRAIRINSGAGFLVVLTGDILRMPGLPRKPLAESIDVVNGEIVGLA